MADFAFILRYDKANKYQINHSRNCYPMNLQLKSIWIFIGLVLLLLLAAVLPTPAIIMLVVALSSVLIVWQVVVVLKDEG